MAARLTDIRAPRVDLVSAPANGAPAPEAGKQEGSMEPDATKPAPPPANTPGDGDVAAALKQAIDELRADGSPACQELADQLEEALASLPLPGTQSKHPVADPTADGRQPAQGLPDQSPYAGSAAGNSLGGQQVVGPGANPGATPNMMPRMPGGQGRRRQGPFIFPIANTAYPVGVRRSMAHVVRHLVRNGLQDMFSAESIGQAELFNETVLDAKDRAETPSSEFAYVDSKGGKHLPIPDAEHVRNALARFNQTTFESDGAKSAAKSKIDAAAKKFGIVAAKRDAGDGDEGSEDTEAVPDDEKATGKKKKVSEATHEVSSDPTFGLHLVESAPGPEGSIWDVILIKSGLSLNKNLYPAEVLTEATTRGLFEGVRAFADHPTNAESRDRPERSVRDIVGWYENSRWDPSSGSVKAHLHLLESADWLRRGMLSAYRQGKPDLYGFSIRAEGRAKVERSGTGTRTVVESLIRIPSVDVVTDPAAGGQVVTLLASNRTPTQEQHMENEGSTSAVEVQKIEEARRETQAALSEARKLVFGAKLEKSLGESKLPEPAQTRVRQLFEGKEEGDIAVAITAERDYLGSVIGFGKDPAATGSIKVGAAEPDKLRHAMFAMIDGESQHEGVPAFRGLREAYCKIKGISDYDVDMGVWMYETYRGTRTEGGANVRLSEAMTTSSWDVIFGDSITRKMLKEYALPGYDTWRQLVSDITSVKDFRTNRRIRMGGYGLLSDVAQGGPYTAINSPTDEEATYAVGKKGNTEQLTMEMLVNDDLGAVRRIPTKLGRAAALTLYRFVFDMVKDNSNNLTYAAVTLYDAGHANSGTAALDSSALTAAKIRMKKQVGYNYPANDALLLQPKFLVVPVDLGPVSQVLLQSDKLPGTLDNDVNIHKGTLTPIEVNYWTDTNDWFLVADPNMVPTIELGFLNGKQEPELFTQDMQNVGVMFDSDQIKYKIRHIYGATLLDHRAFDGNFVT